MNASVVIPTRDRPAALHRCLGAVRGQRGVRLDIVVVDDGSADPGGVATIAREFGARIVHLDGAGPAAARNAGVAAVLTDRTFLLDDDCVPRQGWAEAFVHAAGPGRAVVAGRVLLPPEATIWLRASERIALQVEAASRFFRTLNLSCPTELLLEVPFDETFPVAAGEDRDWCVRAERAGVSFVREPGAAVEHCAVLGAHGFFGQQVRYGRAVGILRRRGTHRPVPGRSLRRGVAAGFRDRPAVGLAMVAAQAAITAGYLIELGSRPSR